MLSVVVCGAASFAQEEAEKSKSVSSYYYGKGSRDWNELTYRYMQRSFEGVAADKNASFYPNELNTKLHIFAARFSLGAIGKLEIGTAYQQSEIQMDIMGTNYSAKVEGISDTRIAYLHTARWDRNYLKADLGVSIPTGNVNRTYTVSMMGRTKTDYVSELGQLGSGTFDINPVFTYKRFAGDFTFANKLDIKARTGRSDRDYRLGNELRNSFWVQYNVRSDLYAFARVNYRSWGDLVESDEVSVPTTSASSRGGQARPSHTKPSQGTRNAQRPATRQAAKAQRPTTGAGKPGAPSSFARPVIPDSTQGGSYVDTVLAAKYQIPTGGARFIRPTIEVGTPIYQKFSTGDFELRSSTYINFAVEAYF